MTLYEELLKFKEYYLAGFAQFPKRTRMFKTANSIYTHFKHRTMPSHGNNAFYPNGYSNPYVDKQICLYSYCEGIASNVNWAIYEDVYSKISKENKVPFEELYKEVFVYFTGQCQNKEYSVGGLSYTHSSINYEKILKEGLDSYFDRIKKNEKKNPQFYKALNVALKAVKVFHKRSIELLKSQENPDKRLIKALQNVPFKPAKDFYEAMVCVNFMYYIDGCDNLGRFDQYMEPYLKDTTDEEAIELLKNLWQNIDDSNGYHVTIGGFNKDGGNGTNRMTHLILKSAKGFRRPQISFLLKEDESKETRDLILDDWLSGSGQPALYNNKLFIKNYGDLLKIKDEDKWKICFGGCTETHVNGHSNTGSTSCGIQNLLIFERAMYYHLPKCKTYEEFYEKLLMSTKRHIINAVMEANLDMELKSKYVALPIRNLFIEDCIDKGIDFQSGGARYNNASMCVSGTSNMFNSLYTLKTLGFGKKYSNEEIMDACKKNFEGYENLLADIKKLPKFGQDNEEIDKIGSDFLKEVTELILTQKAWRGNGPWGVTINLFATFGELGLNVGATPDGRLAKEPIGDSIGATQGDDIYGPTSLINSVTKLPLYNFITVPVFNIRFAKKGLKDKNTRVAINALVDSFFERDGMQMQVTVADQAELIDAVKHPEKHESLIVRIGGYSEYFNRLPEDLKYEVIKRCEHF